MFQSKEEKVEALVKEEMSQINWEEVDSYPLGIDCDEMLSKPLQKKCFQEQVSRFFREAVDDFDADAAHLRGKRFVFTFEVDQDGLVTCLDDIYEAQSIETDVIALHDHLKKSCEDLIFNTPATKKGIPVKMRFQIPIIFKK